MIFKPKAKRGSQGILSLPAQEKKKLFKKAAEKSMKDQEALLRKYDRTFGERIETNR